MIAASITAPSLATNPGTPLPTGPVLSLPCGDVQVLDDGRWFSIHHEWIVAVAVAPEVFFTTRERTKRHIPERLYDELLGYLVACGCWLLRSCAFPARSSSSEWGWLILLASKCELRRVSQLVVGRVWTHIEINTTSS